MNDPDMDEEYDFSKGERGKFFAENATFKFPVYLDASLQQELQLIAEERHAALDETVNDLLKRQIEVMRH